MFFFSGFLHQLHLFVASKLLKSCCAVRMDAAKKKITFRLMYLNQCQLMPIHQNFLIMFLFAVNILKLNQRTKTEITHFLNRLNLNCQFKKIKISIDFSFLSLCLFFFDQTIASGWLHSRNRLPSI